jgi:hypothetical protein
MLVAELGDIGYESFQTDRLSWTHILTQHYLPSRT